MSVKKIVLRQRDSEPGAAYVELQDHPHDANQVSIARSFDVHSLIENYHGPRICIDLNANGQPIGIEILYPDEEDDSDE